MLLWFLLGNFQKFFVILIVLAAVLGTLIDKLQVSSWRKKYIIQYRDK